MKRTKQEIINAMLGGPMDATFADIGSCVLSRLRPPPKTEIDVPVIKRGEKKATGRTTGSTRHCQLGGCSGIRVCVKWSNGRKTWPCSKGMNRSSRGWRIL